MKKTRSLMLLIASLFALTVSAQGLVVHQDNSKQVSFKSKDIHKVEFTESQVENSTDSYVEKSDLDDRLDKLRDEIDKKEEEIELDKLWTEINSILESIKDLYNNKTNKNDIEEAIAQARKEWEALTRENGKGIKKNAEAISSLSNDVADKASQSDFNNMLGKINEISQLVKELQHKAGIEGGSSDSGTDNGHEYIDLGLSVKWATMNVGATEVAGTKTNSHTGQLDCYGEYYAWGETSPKDSYDWSSLKYCTSYDEDSYIFTFSKYIVSSDYGSIDNKTMLEPDDDAAHVNWGGSWRMPTYDELNELKTQCTWTWTTMDGVKGYKVSGPNGSAIFLPAAGYSNGNGFSRIGTGGYYWSSSLDTDCSAGAHVLFFDSNSAEWLSFYRNKGRSVRPVCP